MALIFVVEIAEEEVDVIDDVDGVRLLSLLDVLCIGDDQRVEFVRGDILTTMIVVVISNRTIL